jgi:hypothetical protein
VRRRLLAIFAAVALTFGLGMAVAHEARAATTGPITGYEGLCLDDRSAATTNGNPIQVYTCNGSTAQQWTVAAGNTLQVLGMCLDVAAAGTANGTLVNLYTCNGTVAQVWQPQSNGELINPNSGKCLDDTGFGGAGTQVQIWACADSSNQQWTLPSGGGTPTGAPFGGTAAAVPGTVYAANYDTGGQGVAYNTTSSNGTANTYRSDGIDLEATSDTQNNTGAGADDLGWTTTGQWFKYTVNVATAGTYTVSLRLASPNGVADALHIANSAGTSLSGAVAAPATGGWQTWSTATTSVTLPAGQQTLTIDQDNAGWNVHYLSFATSGGNGNGTAPNLGPNVYVFNTSMSTTTIQNDINSVYNTQQSNQFGTQRYELMFEPGTYNVNIPVGFYTEVVGLGQNPSQTVITGGGIHADAAWNGGNATTNFWRGVENITNDPSSGSTEWAVSQADPMRRVQIDGNMVLDDDTSGNTSSNWSSGGFISDSVVTGQVNSGTQQQFIMRNDQLGSWTGSNWNMVFVGSTGVPGQSFPTYTTVNQTPTVDEKPYLYTDSSGNWDVFVPSTRTSSQGVSWANGNTPGTSLPISDFYIATPSSTVAQINAALAGGQDLLFTPGVYQINGTINVTNPDTVVLGLGLATLVSNGGNTILQTADVNGIRIGGLIFDAGTTNSSVLVQIGPSGSSASHASDPTVLSDVFARIGGATVGKATQTLQVNSANVVGDDLWLWRADHGNNGTVGWTTNTAANGLVVNGANDTFYGLAVEHYQAVQVQWNGNGGADYFYQSEMPYDPPSQSAWMDGSSDGYPSIAVSNSVTSFKAFGLGVYCFFNVNPSEISANALTSPNSSGVQWNDMVTVSLGGTGTIQHIINGTGGTVNSGSTVADLTSYN